MTEKEFEEFKKRFSAYNQEEEKVFNGLDALCIAFFVCFILLAYLKAWGFIW